MTRQNASLTVEGSGSVIELPNAAGSATFSAAGAGQWVHAPAAKCSFELVLSDTVTPFAVFEVHMSNDTNAVPGPGTYAGELSASGALGRDSLSKDSAAYAFKRVECVTLTGASATAAVKMGY